MVGHSWHLRSPSPSFSRERMELLVDDFGHLLPHLPLLASPNGHLLPLGNAQVLAFNGRHPADGEPFVFPGESWEEKAEFFGACSTGGRPYDLAVRVALLLARIHFGDHLTINSHAHLSEWAKAALLIEARLSYPVDLYWALRRRLCLVVDAKGKRFLYECPDGGGARFVQGVLGRIEKLMGGRWPFVPPYQVEEEAVRLDLPELTKERLFAAAYRLPVGKR